MLLLLLLAADYWRHIDGCLPASGFAPLPPLMFSPPFCCCAAAEWHTAIAYVSLLSLMMPLHDAAPFFAD